MTGYDYSNYVYNSLSSVIDEIYTNYSFIDMPRSDYEELVRDIIKSFKYDSDLIDSSQQIYYKKLIIGQLNEYIKEQLNNSNYKILVNYINTIIPDTGNYKRMLSSLTKIHNFFEILDYDISIDTLVSLASDNKKLDYALEVVYNKDKKKIENGDFQKYDDTTGSLIQAYCILHQIDIKDDSDDIFEEFVADDASIELMTNDHEIFDGNSDLSFLKIANSYKTLSPDKQRELVKKAQNGDEGARELLINSSLKLVVFVAKRYSNLGLCIDDLLQEGLTGLIKAVDKFDYNNPTKFSTYAFWWIRQAILRSLHDTGRNIRIPVYYHEIMIKVLKAQKEFTTANGREATNEELASILKISEKTISDIISVGIQTNTLSINSLVDDDKETEFGAFIPSPVGNPEDDVNLLTLNMFLELFKDAGLNDIQIKVLVYRYGLIPNEEACTLQELGKKYGITRERIRQIEQNALIKLVRFKKTEAFASYMDNPDVALKTIRLLREKSYEKGYNHKKVSQMVYAEVSENYTDIDFEGEIKKTRQSRKKKTRVKEGKKDMARHNKRIYELLGITREEYDKFIVPTLSSSESLLIKEKFGEDIEDDSFKSEMSRGDRSRFYSWFVPKLRKRVANLGLGSANTSIGEVVGTETATVAENNENIKAVDNHVTIIETVSEEMVSTEVTGKDTVLDATVDTDIVSENEGNRSVCEITQCSVNAKPENLQSNLSKMSDQQLNCFIEEMSRQCEEIEARLETKKRKLDKAVSLYEKRSYLLERERQLDEEIASKINSYKSDEKVKKYEQRSNN